VGMALCSLSQLAALKETETSKCYFMSYDVNFSSEKYEYPTEFIANYYEEPWSYSIGMTHL
jgi:hypothetical protein